MRSEVLSVEDLIQFVLLEREVAAADNRFRDLLTLDGLVDRGESVRDLMLLEDDCDSWFLFRCPRNDSKLRKGDAVTVFIQEGEGAGVSFEGSILDILENGLEFRVAPAREITRSLPQGPWAITLLPVDLSPIVLGALKKLAEGGPGWGLYEILTGLRQPPDFAPRPLEPRQQQLAALEERTGLALDQSQREAFMACTALPVIYGVQGPPGTGKTNLLALVAEALAVEGRNVLIVAPTHQAVNNAISTVKDFFPERAVFKVGDELRTESLSKAVGKATLSQVEERTSGQRRGTKVGSVLGMTFLSVMAQMVLRQGRFHPQVVLVDEAGQLPMSQGACVGVLGASSVLLFGDDQQMPPVFNSDVAGDPYAHSIFVELRRNQPQLITMLKTTYRLNSNLCEIIGRTFYPAPNGGTALIPSSGTAGRVFGFQRADNDESLAAKALASSASLVWVDSGETVTRDLCLPEARFVAEIVSKAISHLGDLRKVAVVTPFRRQAAAIRGLLQPSLPPQSNQLIVDTVERVQGLTVELICFSLAAADREYAAQMGSFLFSPNRLNVALSRARTKVIVVASSEVLLAIPTEYSGVVGQNAWIVLLDQAGATFRLMEPYHA